MVRTVMIVLTIQILFIQWAKDVEANEADFGIIICGSGNGASMTANKHQRVRCALCGIKKLCH